MAKANNPKNIQANQQTTKPAPEPVLTEKGPKKPLSVYDFKVQAIVVSLLAFIFYFNSFFNEYAHDDGIVIVKNEYVQEGFAGIPNILTKDAYDSYYRQLNTTNQLEGGRFRPLSIVTFAIEQQFLGAVSEDKVDSVLKQNISYGVRGPQEEKLIFNMHVRHVFNVLWYIFSLIALLYFLRYIVFKTEPMMAFIATILFAIHPIHTEVVANVKSRDEIMSLLFMCGTFIYTFKYREQKKISMLLLAMLSYFFAFLSKEYAITMVVLLPMSLVIFNKDSIKTSILTFLPFTAVIAAYLMMRFSIVTEMGANSTNEVLNNPYLFATPVQKLATEISTSLNYLKLLIFPHPLSADYSFSSIPYSDFSNLGVWLSITVHVGLVGALVYFVSVVLKTAPKTEVAGVKQDNTNKRMVAGIMSFAIAFYLIHLLLVCNIIFDIGATMGERLIYHSSVGFAIAVAYLLVKAVNNVQPAAAGQKALAGIMGVIIILCGIKTISRNADWKNDGTLFGADIKTVPNSVLVNGNVAASYITLADYQKDEGTRRKYLTDAIGMLNHALSFHPTFVAGYLNRGIAWYKLGEIDTALANFNKVKTLYPTYPTLPGLYRIAADFYSKRGWDKYGRFGRYPEAIVEFKKGLALDSANAELWYNMGGAYYSSMQFNDAIASWKMALKIKPDYTQAQQGMQAAMGVLQNGGVPPKK